ncbi:hypothetical protein DVH05_021079 [Phytophthora capsici]|nr:hypothetical protein DVH05_021079 [Phytophthora capsici]
MKKPVKNQKKTDKRQTVSFHTWTAALAAVNDGMSLSLAAKTYGASREPLRLRHLDLVPIVARPGPQLIYLSEGGDRGLVEIIVYRALHGMCVSFDELRGMLRRAAEETGTRPLTGRLTVTERQKRVLRELDLDVDGLNVVNLLRTSSTALIPQKRADGKWVDENYSDGDLLSYEEMKAAVQAKEDAKALKEANKTSAPLEEKE